MKLLVGTGEFCYENCSKFGRRSKRNAAAQVSFAQKFHRIRAQSATEAFRRKGALENLQLDFSRDEIRIMHPKFIVIFVHCSAYCFSRFKRCCLDCIFYHIKQNSSQQSFVGFNFNIGGSRIDLYCFVANKIIFFVRAYNFT